MTTRTQRAAMKATVRTIAMTALTAQGAAPRADAGDGITKKRESFIQSRLAAKQSTKSTL